MAPSDIRFDDERHRKRGTRVARMFNRIAPTYDLLNHVLSANIDVAWRRKTVAALGLRGTERCLDACTGTGDLAVALLEGGAKEVVGSDFAEEMLEIARKKVGARATFRQADTTRLPFESASFDVATVGFGVRNIEDLDAGLRELRRVLAPGGRLAILEFSRPPNLLVRAAYDFYFRLLLPLIGNLVSGGAENAYSYLPRSVMTFPAPAALADRLRAAGFDEVSYEALTFGIAHLHVARLAP